MCNDAHFLFTGYGKYGLEVLTRLARTEKFELAELACYGEINDSRDMNAEWKYYANAVSKSSPYWNSFKSHPQNEFGHWRFERTCLDFRPDIVFDIRDPWMFTFEGLSPLRPFFHWTIMPTVDSSPQQEEWLELFSEADGVFTYSEYGQKVLEKESSGTIPIVRTAPPGVDLDIFRPVHDKKAHREKMGFMPEANIIGTIMRNQARKLYPDLFEAFRKFLDNCYTKGEVQLANNTYLYVHCSYPDMGWEIPTLLKEHGIGRKVIFTYICKNCDNPFCSLFRDARTVCPRCSYASAVLPSPSSGLSPRQLSEVLNTFDVYIQYSVCEGFGMPQVEAAACGVPIMAVDYSAMEDILDHTQGIRIPVQRMFRDVGTGAYRALPDNDACASEIYKFFKKPTGMRRVMGNKARKAAELHWNWDKTAKIWEEYFDQVELNNLHGKWSAPMQSCGKPPSMPDPKKVTNPIYIDWLISHVMKEPRFLNTRFAMKYLRQLNYGGRTSGREITPVTRKTLYDDMCSYAANKTDCEMARTGQMMLSPMDYIEYANQREKYLR